MNKALLPVVLAALLLLDVPLYAQETLTFAWEYDQVEAELVAEWKLYQSHTSGGPYTLVPVSIMKVGNQANYDAVVPSNDLLKGTVYFVLTAYGDESWPIENRESGYSNEVNHTFSLNAPFNLILTVVPQ